MNISRFKFIKFTEKNRPKRIESNVSEADLGKAS